MRRFLDLVPLTDRPDETTDVVVVVVVGSGHIGRASVDVMEPAVIVTLVN